MLLRNPASQNQVGEHFQSLLESRKGVFVWICRITNFCIDQPVSPVLLQLPGNSVTIMRCART
jgi:hypothetical protein